MISDAAAEAISFFTSSIGTVLIFCPTTYIFCVPISELKLDICIYVSLCYFSGFAFGVVAIPTLDLATR